MDHTNMNFDIGVPWGGGGYAGHGSGRTRLDPGSFTYYRSLGLL